MDNLEDFSDYFWDAYFELLEFKEMNLRDLSIKGYLNILDI